MVEQELPAAQSIKPDGLVAVGLAVAALVLYLLTLAPTVLEADGGEFQFVPWLPGIAHPTGYPLYILLGWLWTHLLPFGEVAWRMNLLSAVLAAAAVGVTYAVARQIVDLTFPETPLAGRVLSAVLAAATFAVTHTFWSQAIIAEVYALHALFVALILWLALKVQGANFDPRSGWAKVLTLTFGLSLTHHRTIVLLVPALVLFYVTGRRGAEGQRSGGAEERRSGGVAQQQPPIPNPQSAIRNPQFLVLLVAPLLLYLYLPLIAPFTPYATLTLSKTQTLTLYENSLRGFWNHVWGTVFTGEVQPAAAGLDRLGLIWQLLRQQVGWIGAGLALVGLVSLWQRRRFDLLGLTGLALVGLVGFNLIYFIGDVFVLFIPVWLLVCLWIGLGALGLSHGLAHRFVRRRIGPSDTAAFTKLNVRLEQGIYRLVIMILLAGFLLLPLVLGATRHQELDQTHNFAAGRRWHEILAEPIPPQAVLLSNDRNEMMPMWYYQYVEGRRPDLLGLFPLIVTEPEYATIGRVLDQALASGRPVYAIKPMDGLGLKADLVPKGSLFRVTAFDDRLPAHPHDVLLPEITVDPSRTETIKILGYDLATAEAGNTAETAPGEAITITLYWQTTQKLSIDYTSYVHLVAADGHGITQNDHRPGGSFYPSSQWQVGEVLHDRHILTIPPETPAGMYRLRVGLYYQPEPGVISGMGSGEEIGLIEVVNP
jgi:hypothetical protein